MKKVLLMVIKASRVFLYISFFIGILFLNVCSPSKEKYGSKTIASVVLHPKSGSNMEGKVTIRENEGKVMMFIELSNLKKGTYAVHIHETGNCDSKDGTSAGGHWNPTNEQHGKWDSSSFHSGDIGNIIINDNGEGFLEHIDRGRWCVGCFDDKKNIVNKSIIIHEREDDFTSQPTGSAGKRIGCGVILLL